MDDEGVGCEIVREALTAARFKDEVLPRVCAEPAGNFHRADVVALAVVGAALRDEDAITVPKLVDHSDAVHGALKIALVAGHQDRKRGQRHILGRVRRNLREGLTVRDHEGRLFAEARERFAQSGLLDDDARRVAVEHVAQGLLLRQDEAALRRGGVDGRHEHDEVARADEIADDPLFRALGRCCDGETVLEFLNARTGQRADGNAVRRGHPVRRLEVRLVVGDEIRDVLFLEDTDELAVAVCVSHRGVNDEDGDVRAVQNLLCAAHALCPERALVVKARRVDDRDGAQRQQLHGLGNGVGRRAPNFGHEGDLLPGDGVDDAGLTRVPPPEKTDVDALRARRIVKTHTIFLPESEFSVSDYSLCRSPLSMHVTQ